MRLRTFPWSAYSLTAGIARGFISRIRTRRSQLLLRQRRRLAMAAFLRYGHPTRGGRPRLSRCRGALNLRGVGGRSRGAGEARGGLAVTRLLFGGGGGPWRFLLFARRRLHAHVLIRAGAAARRETARCTQLSLVVGELSRTYKRPVIVSHGLQPSGQYSAGFVFARCPFCYRKSKRRLCHLLT